MPKAQNQNITHTLFDIISLGVDAVLLCPGHMKDSSHLSKQKNVTAQYRE